jgi:eukaryotic-like serine/threonine-protein kinase
MPDLDELIADFLSALERGESPDLADLMARHPEHVTELAAFVRDLGQFGGFLGLPDLPATQLTVEYVPSSGPGSSVALPPGERFGEYELLGEPIGSGGMGVVYRARLMGTSLVVALKQVRVQAGASTTRFREEIETAARLKHPNIVPVYHVGEHSGRPFFTMALIEGGSLDQKMKLLRDDFPAIAKVVRQVARAVHYAHQRRVLHRDLKPSNILIDEAGDPHVADFGLATRLTESGATVDILPVEGSLPWMAPETLRVDSILTTAVDVWAIGVILFELLTGERPIASQHPKQMMEAILSQPIPEIRQLNPRVPRDLEAVCRRCLERDPEKRYESASAIALELDRWLRDEPVRARRTSRTERLARWTRRNPAEAIGVVLLMVLLTTAAVIAWGLAHEQDVQTRRVVCEDNEYAAELAAGAFLRRIDQQRVNIQELASDRGLLQACESVDHREMTRLLRQAVEAPNSTGSLEMASLYVLDGSGRMQAIWPERTQIVGEDFSYRDYFHGALARAHLKGRERVHLSRVYRAKNDSLDKLAVSIAFQPKVGGPNWVLAATIPTDPTFGLGVHDDHRHKVVLLAPRETERDATQDLTMQYSVIVHPSYARGDESIDFPKDGLRKVFRSDGQPRFAPIDDYLDPVRIRYPDCDGRWLAGFAQVEGTDLIVLVQQRYDDAVGLNRSLLRRLFLWLSGGLLLGFLVFVLVQQIRAARSSRNS